MEYRLKIQEKTLPVEINNNEGNSATAIIEEREYNLKYTLISENELHLMVNGKSINVYLAKNKNGKTILLNGRTYQVQDEDNLPKGPKKKKGIDGPTKVTPPMPAVVIAVNVTKGDRVEKGQKVVVVSAMKMETTLVAPYKGIVTRVNVQVSDKVMPGDILVDIDEIKDDTVSGLES
jgi:acetyl/propionyl-CoA carboxylase alpha subunit